MDEARARAGSWKRATSALVDDARAAAPYRSGTAAYDFCLPAEHAAANLLPTVRRQALDLFDELGIPWHHGVAGGPSNHLLSSQVQCVNALGAMVDDPSRVVRVFGDVLPIDRVVEIEPGRHLTFEYIGPVDYFGEVPRGPRRRGAQCTSVDAAFRYESRDGESCLALVEWKYTEKYPGTVPDPHRNAERLARYGEAIRDPQGPIRGDLVDPEVLLAEPLYQLVRQQLLAHRLERDPSTGYDRVDVVHVLSPRNLAYQTGFSAALRPLGSTVDQVWAALLRHPDRFRHLDPQVFCNPEMTSVDYVERYGVDH